MGRLSIKTNEMLTLIIVSYNSHQIIAKCLSKLIHQSEYPIIIIDNASPDGSSEILKNQFPDVKVIPLPQNIGYGRAANIGLHEADTPYVLLLNPDLNITNEDIEKLFECAQNDNSNTAIWAPAVLKEDFTGEHPINVKQISGCVMLFHRERLYKIGLFDENIFLYYEETDLCERTMRSGYEIKLCRNIFFNHLIGQASPSSPDIEYLKNWHFGWSHCYFYTKHNLWRIADIKRYLFRYQRKSITLNRSKRLAFRARIDGIKAFMGNQSAFEEFEKSRSFI